MRANRKIGKTITKEVEYIHSVVFLTVFLIEVPKEVKRTERNITMDAIKLTIKLWLRFNLLNVLRLAKS